MNDDENVSDEEYEEEEYMEEDDELHEKRVIKPIVIIEKKSLPILSKFEYATLLGTRIKQLDEGARTTLNKEELKNIDSHRKIAEKEITLRKLPLLVQRELPDGSVEEWKLSEFLTIHND